MTTENKIKKYSQQLKQAQREHDESVGKLNEIEASLKREFDVKSISQAEKKVKTLESEINKLRSQISEMVEDLENDYDWE